MEPEQQVAYVDYLLDHEKFTFDTDERVTINRKDLPYPKNLDEARKLWRDRLRAEYLQEKLVESSAEKKVARSVRKEANANEVSKLSTFEKANVPSNYSKEANAGQTAAQASAKPKTGHEGIVLDLSGVVATAVDGFRRRRGSPSGSTSTWRRAADRDDTDRRGRDAAPAGRDEPRQQRHQVHAGARAADGVGRVRGRDPRCCA